MQQQGCPQKWRKKKCVNQKERISRKHPSQLNGFLRIGTAKTALDYATNNKMPKNDKLFINLNPKTDLIKRNGGGAYWKTLHHEPRHQKHQ
jgi:hypothetical protein